MEADPLQRIFATSDKNGDGGLDEVRAERQRRAAAVFAQGPGRPACYLDAIRLPLNPAAPA